MNLETIHHSDSKVQTVCYAKRGLRPSLRTGLKAYSFSVSRTAAQPDIPQLCNFFGKFFHLRCFHTPGDLRALPGGGSDAR
ncbi:MAG TPA: hypothetical protein VJ464_14555 [Blastocatellia bacterium]|nr:hypothetical protein [Blastocatellia bacterium]